MTFTPALEIVGLRVSLPTASGVLHAVRGVDLRVARGETLCLVGESGSGKSMTALAALGLLPDRARLAATRLELLGEDMRAADERIWRARRGDRVAMIFQDPMSALDPSWSVGEQMIEGFRVHRPGVGRRDALARAAELLALCGIDRPALRLRQYPHVLSGGMRQRVMIAMALMTEPALLIADEPTSALDATVRAQVLDLLENLRRRFSLGLLLITHDLGVARRHAARVAVMRSGEIVETGATVDIFERPAHDYTRALLAARPGASPLARVIVEEGENAVTLAGVGVRFSARMGLFGPRQATQALGGIDLRIPVGSVCGIVGESGSGKSTLARVILGLQPAAGRVELLGRPLEEYSRRALARVAQPVFQNPYASLNPRRRVAAIIRLPLDVHGIGARAGRDAAVRAMMARCGLPPRLAEAYPGALSGGQRQRVAIATALIMRPRIVVCDEPTSALDVSVQAQILALLRELRAEFGLTYVFISHDLAVVRALADFVVVMRAGVVVEQAATATLFAAPTHEYTAALLAAVA